MRGCIFRASGCTAPAGEGAVSPQAVEFCKEHGIAVVPGECPYMFLSGEHWGHRLHGFVKKIVRGVSGLACGRIRPK